MRVIGIDPGLAAMGWAIVETAGSSLHPVAYGCVTTAPGSLPQRLFDVAAELRSLIEKHRPEEAAVEELFFAKESKSAAGVAHARGAILLTLKSMGLPVHEYNPRTVKMSLTGYGGADKSQMQNMVQRLLGLASRPRPDDTADALAVALCHFQNGSLDRALKRIHA